MTIGRDKFSGSAIKVKTNDYLYSDEVVKRPRRKPLEKKVCDYPGCGTVLNSFDRQGGRRRCYQHQHLVVVTCQDGKKKVQRVQEKPPMKYVKDMATAVDILEPATIGEVALFAKVPLSTAQERIRQMREKGLLSSERKGNFRYYSLTKEGRAWVD